MISRKAVIIIMILSVILAGYGYVNIYFYNLESDNFVESEDVVITSTDVLSEGSDDDIEYRPSVHYEYTVNGESYTSVEVYPSGAAKTFDTKEKAEAVISDTNQELHSVYYNPDNPRSSYLIQSEINSSNKGFILINLVIATLGSIKLVLTGLRERKEHSEMTEREISNINNIISTGEEVEVQGDCVECDERSNTSPITGESAPIVKYRLESYWDRSGKPGVWMDITNGIDFHPFYIEDDTGVMPVEPNENANFDFKSSDTIEWDNSENMPNQVFDFLRDAKDLDPRELNDSKYRIKASSINVGSNVFVHGTTDYGNETYNKGNSSFVITGSEESEFIISDKSKEEAKKSRKYGVVNFALALVFFCVALFTFITGYGII